MKIFISGGCKNGKSYFAQQLSKAQAIDKLYYIATMAPADNEDLARISKHIANRKGWGFETREQPADIDKIVDTCQVNGSFLLDSLTALLANEMFLKTGVMNPCIYEKIEKDLSRVLSNINNIVIVSDYIYSDANPYDSVTENYRRGLAYLDRFCAAKCDVVLESVYTQLIVHKGRERFQSLYEKII